MPTIEQIRAARALLGWSQSDLADQAGLSQTGIARIENGTNQPNSQTIAKIEAAFDKADVEFLDDSGVRKVKDRLKILEGKNSLQQLQDDIYHTLSGKGGEVLLLGMDEVSPDEKADYEYTKMHIERLRKAGIKERILVENTEDNYLAPKEWYKTMSAEYFCPHTVFIYDTKIALTLREPHFRVLILDNPFFAECLKTFFNFIWDHAEKV